MASHTIKVTGVPEELLQLLDQRIRTQHATGRSEYIRELIRRDVLPSPGAPTGWPSAEMPFRELLAPVQAEAERVGESEDETEAFLREQLESHRKERRARTPGGA
jgi:hypothetical protein